MFEKEAEENLVEQLGFDKEFIEQEVNKLKNPNNKFMVDALIREVKFAFQKGAEFGYNKGKAETALLSQHIIDLQKDKGNLTDRVRELEQQIEKMKCCGNCKHSRTDYEHCITDKHEKWEIKENDNTRIIK